MGTLRNGGEIYRNPPKIHQNRYFMRICWLKLRNHNPCVGGSNPSSATTRCCAILFARARREPRVFEEWAAPQVGSYPGYTGRDADVAAEAAHYPELIPS